VEPGGRVAPVLPFYPCVFMPVAATGHDMVAADLPWVWVCEGYIKEEFTQRSLDKQ
jgi:hypothetical protein